MNAEGSPGRLLKLVENRETIDFDRLEKLLRGVCGCIIKVYGMGKHYFGFPVQILSYFEVS